MRDFIKRLQDKNILTNLVIAVILIGLHTWQFIKSEYEIKPLVNLIMVGIFLITTLIFGSRSLPIFLMVYSFVWLPFEEFDSYTSLLLLLSAISLDKKLGVCFKPYCITVFICYMFNDMEISHVGVTACYLIFFWTVYKQVRSKHNDVKLLVLTDDEENILQELCSGKEVKELNLSEKTVYNRLREARERNNCVTNEELKKQYKAMVRTATSNLQ